MTDHNILYSLCTPVFYKPCLKCAVFGILFVLDVAKSCAGVIRNTDSCCVGVTRDTDSCAGAIRDTDSCCVGVTRLTGYVGAIREGFDAMLCFHLRDLACRDLCYFIGPGLVFIYTTQFFCYP